MKELTIVSPQKIILTLDDLNEFEKKYNIILETRVKEFIVKYAGTVVKEIFFQGKQEINQFLYLNHHPKGASIDAILEGHQYYEVSGYFPFAIDAGGWDYNISLKEETYGQIWVNKWDNGDGEGEDCLFFVADSFEEFIDGLQAEEVND